jgi:hypothetical protein
LPKGEKGRAQQTDPAKHVDLAPAADMSGCETYKSGDSLDQGRPIRMCDFRPEVMRQWYHPAGQGDQIAVRNFRLPFSEVPVFSQYLVEWTRHSQSGNLA